MVAPARSGVQARSGEHSRASGVAGQAPCLRIICVGRLVSLATQLIDRQTAAYDPSDIEDRYEKRLKEMIQAKLKGEGIEMSEAAQPAVSNVVDLMATLKKSLAEAAPRAGQAKPAPEPVEAPAKARRPARKRA